MKFGLFLGPFERSTDHLVEQGELAEALGYDSLWIPEHHGLVERFYPSPLMLLAGLATRTRRVKLGTAILLLPFYHPLRLAEDVAVLDVVSNGRTILGVGMGYREAESRLFGLKMAERVPRMTEGVRLLRALWRGEASKDLAEFAGFQFFPLPVQPGGPPIWMGGYVEAAVRRAAQLGDAWFPAMSARLDLLESLSAVYRAALRSEGREPTETPLCREVFVASTAKAARAIAGEALERTYLEYQSWGATAVSGSSRTATAAARDEDFAEDRFILGDPETCIREIERYRERLGISHLICRMQVPGVEHKDALASMRLFASEVMPHFGAERAASRRGEDS
jgi:alkanesulfonate monooxygenase SsuD/methylene tetrahydromethanopterin reductase-like flavin-dependent oxidoreductase (luciferase family)